MIHQTTKTFKKYLETSFPGNVSHLFLILSPDSYERMKLIELVSKYVPNSSTFSVSRFSTKENGVEKALNALQEVLLLGSEPIVILDEIDGIDSRGEKLLLNFLKNPITSGYLILNGEKKKGMVNLFGEIEKRAVVIDLSLEKPWDKEKRLLEAVSEKCARYKKSISAPAMELLLSRAGLDLSLVEAEVDKLTLFVGDKPIVEEKDVVSIVSLSNQSSIWQIAEKIVWEKERPDFKDLEIADFYKLIGAVRYQLQIGCKLASGSLENFSKMAPKLFFTRQKQARELGDFFFKEGLEKLFEIELISKNNVTSFLALMDLFIAKLSIRPLA